MGIYALLNCKNYEKAQVYINRMRQNIQTITLQAASILEEIEIEISNTLNTKRAVEEAFKE